jgi:hypothetical protein
MKILLPLLSLLISACSVQDAVTGAQISTDLAVAQSSYAETRASVERRLSSLSEEKAAEVRALLADADSLKASIEAIWTDKLIPTAADVAVLYQSGVALYARGTALVAPLLSAMPIADQIRVRRFGDTLRSLGEHYQAWLESPTAQSQAATLSQGMELAKMAVQIGLVLL